MRSMMIMMDENIIRIFHINQYWPAFFLIVLHNKLRYSIDYVIQFI